jgi:hypothetical protein
MDRLWEGLSEGQIIGRTHSERGFTGWKTHDRAADHEHLEIKQIYLRIRRVVVVRKLHNALLECGQGYHLA